VVRTDGALELANGTGSSGSSCQAGVNGIYLRRGRAVAGATRPRSPAMNVSPQVRCWCIEHGHQSRCVARHGDRRGFSTPGTAKCHRGIVKTLRHNASGHHREPHLFLYERFRPPWWDRWLARRRLWTTSTPRGASFQLITRPVPFPCEPRATSNSATEHSAGRRIARNEQARGSSPRPGSTVHDQRLRVARSRELAAVE
jgi:hypothetical protein